MVRAILQQITVADIAQDDEVDDENILLSQQLTLVRVISRVDINVVDFIQLIQEECLYIIKNRKTTDSVLSQILRLIKELSLKLNTIIL